MFARAREAVALSAVADKIERLQNMLFLNFYLLCRQLIVNEDTCGGHSTLDGPAYIIVVSAVERQRTNLLPQIAAVCA